CHDHPARLATILGLTEGDLDPEILNDASHEIRSQFLAAGKARSAKKWMSSCKHSGKKTKTGFDPSHE
ncbi:MAG: hypothetical protein ACC628_04865, partial [Pirellulaceae bacterium]